MKIKKRRDVANNENISYIISNDCSNIEYNENESEKNQDRLDFYKAVLPLLGINLTASEYDTLAGDNKRVTTLNKSLKELPEILRSAKEGMRFKDLINLKKGRVATEGYFKEKISKILQVTGSLDSSKKVLGRVRFQGNT